MSTVVALLSRALLAAEGLLGAITGYLLLLTGAALFAPRRTPPREGPPVSRFAVMIPAHNEERLLPGLLESLGALDYPRDRLTVFVVADNCRDGTAALARARGAEVYERFNSEQIGKGYALEWLLQRIWERPEAYDAYLILDADSILSANFLRVMDARLARGERVIQGYYAVRDPGGAPSAGLRAAALTVLHFLRPQGRMVLGGSAGLKGNGMVFADPVIRAHRWTASLTEDIEYHMRLILAGERAAFAPDAIVWAEMPSTLAAADTQNERWEQGRLEMLRGYVPRLLREGLRRRSFLLVDAAVEQLIPPFSLVAAGSLASLLCAALLRSRRRAAGAVALVLGQAIYLFAGLRLGGAPPAVYRALLHTPAFVAWKLWLYARVALGQNRRGWIRTARNEGPAATGPATGEGHRGGAD